MVGTKTVTSLPEQLILKKKIEDLKMDRIADRLCIDGFESRINAGADYLQFGDVILLSPQELKSHLVATNCKGVYFWGFFCPYNILTRIQQRLKGEETLVEVFKHKKDLASLKFSEDESITVYTLSIVAPSLFGGKRSTKSDIGPLPDYTKRCNNYLQTVLGYDIDKMLDPVY